MEYKVGLPFEICGIREFVYDTDGPAFLKRELEIFGMDRSEFPIIHVNQCLFKCFESI